MEESLRGWEELVEEAGAASVGFWLGKLERIPMLRVQDGGSRRSEVAATPAIGAGQKVRDRQSNKPYAVRRGALLCLDDTLPVSPGGRPYRPLVQGLCSQFAATGAGG